MRPLISIRRRHVLIAIPALLIAALGALLLTDSTASLRRQVAAATPTAPPTATPTPLPPPPFSVPSEWQVYRGHHFALAYPPRWMVSEDSDAQSAPSSSPTALATAVSINFEATDGTAAVAISEREGLDQSALRQVCGQQGTHTTFAGLPVISAAQAYSLRSYIFAASDGVVYTLLYDDVDSSADARALDIAVLSTFRPEYTSPACQ
jgi:hypothetical protein